MSKPVKVAGQRDRQIVIRLDTDAPLHGVIEDETGAQVFSGWLELLTVLDSALHAERSAPTTNRAEGD